MENGKLNIENLEEISTKKILLLAIPVCIIFAISGMDFIGYIIYLINRSSSSEPYSRALWNVLLGFIFTTISLFIIPLYVLKNKWKKDTTDFGTKPGNSKLGLLILGGFLLISPILYFLSDDPELIKTYPLNKDVLDSWTLFIVYEILYVIFYYIPYEFFFRGVLQLGLSKKWQYWKSILLVTIITTLLHVTKPFSEILAAFVGGIIFGIIAEKTDSWYYVFGIHFIIGVLNDLFSGLRFLGMV